MRIWPTARTVCIWHQLYYQHTPASSNWLGAPHKLQTALAPPYGSQWLPCSNAGCAMPRTCMSEVSHRSLHLNTCLYAHHSLRVMVRALQEHEARWFFQQLIIALDYAHRMNVVSRDIKLENTLLDGSRRPLLKICDFGYSKNTEKDSVPKSRVGTPGYTGAHTLPLCRTPPWSSEIC